jgi:hypothetical protein
MERPGRALSGVLPVVERRKRGPFGWTVAILFLGFNGLMAWWFVDAMTEPAQLVTGTTNQAEPEGATLGTGIGTMMILIIWGVGSFVLGVMTYFTRFRRIINITED